MVRKLFIVLVTLAMLSPVAAFALGFGNIKLDSALNERLDANIAIISPTPQDISNLKVQLASHEAFQQAGIDMPSSLMSLKFAVKQRGDTGQYYIHLTSTQPIREPYLDFLLQMTWPTGRMLREYTVLLDPPNLVRKAAPAEIQTPVVQPPVAVRPAPAPTPAPAPAPVPSRPTAATPPTAVTRPAPTRPSASAPAPAAAPSSAPASTSTLAQTAQRDENRGLFPYIPIAGEAQTRPSPATEQAMLTHITRKGDKLWDIAQQMRPDDSVSLYQMMMALLKSNPQAFEQGNVNRLKAGYVLRINNPALLTAMSKPEAAKAFEMQTREWEAYRQRAARAAGKRPLVTQNKQAEAAGPGTPSAETGKLELVTPNGKAETAGSGQATLLPAGKIKDIKTARKQLSLAIEAAETERRKNAEMTSRLKQLESQIADMQRLIALKDDELAALQEQMHQQTSKENGSATAPPSTPATTAATVSVTPSVAPAETPAVAPTVSATQSTPATAANASTTIPATEAAAQQSTPAATPATTSVAPEAAPKHAETPVESHQATPPAKPMPEPTPAPSAQPWWLAALSAAGGFLAFLMSSPLLLAAAVAVLLILALLLVVLRRRKKGYGFQESILTGDANVVEQTPEAGGKAGEESSFLSDFAVSGVNAIQEDSEVDPLTEADVYVAYGRYQQAEELLTEALKHDPKRKDVKLKLLEVHHANQNRAGFEAVAEDLYPDIGDPDSAEWKKVVDMGAELAPNNPMFAGSTAKPEDATAKLAAAAGAAAIGAGAANLSKDDVMDIGLDTGTFQSDDFKGAEPEHTADEQNAPVAAEDDLGFDLDLSEPASADDAASDLDFNLDFDDSATPAADDAATSTGSDAQKSADDLDFNLDFAEQNDEPPTPPAATTTAPEATTAPAAEDEFALDFNVDEPDDKRDAEESGLDFDLGGLDLEAPPVADADSREDDTRIDLETPPGLRDDDTAVDMDSPKGLRDEDTEVELSALEAGPAEPAPMDFDLDAGDAGGLEMPDDLDEVGTKLDLARAYIEMGDPDGARSILDEVMDEGNDKQKQDAQALISQLG